MCTALTTIDLQENGLADVQVVHSHSLLRADETNVNLKNSPSKGCACTVPADGGVLGAAARSAVPVHEGQPSCGRHEGLSQDPHRPDHAAHILG